MKGFVISWYFPPINSSEGLVTYKLLKASKYEHDVFTQNKNESWSYGKNETKLTSKNIKPIFANTSDVNLWVDEGVSYFEEHKNEYDFIMSRSMSEKSHEIALKIKEKNKNLYWIASFGDPIADNPYNYFCCKKPPYSCKGLGIENVSTRYLFSPIRIIKNLNWHIRRKLYYMRDKNSPYNMEKLQKKVFKYADKIILNNEYQKEHMLRKYNLEEKKKLLEKIIILPHSYDKDFYDYKNKKSKNDKIVISYLGHLDDIRNAHNFLKAVNRIKEQNISEFKKLDINFYGDMSINDKAYILDNKLYDVVKINKPITYFESLEIMQKSDYLLLIDANLSKYLNKNIFFAAKIADYLGSKTKIIGITMEEGPSAEILRDTNSIVTSYSTEDIYMTLKKILNGKYSGEIKNTEKYDSRNVAKLYDKIIDNIKM